MDFKPIARVLLCARIECRARVVICPKCDRGQIYCGGECAKWARRRSLLGAGKRYQSSYAGRVKHAARQRRYRARRQKVTHQSSLAAPVDVLLIPAAAPYPPVATLLDTAPVKTPSHCHFCARLCSDFVRSGFLDGRPIECPSHPGQRKRRGGKYGRSP